jgi:putative ABC transport system ATP-binding protein
MIDGLDICKKFGDREIIKNLNFHIDSGEFVCFSGESGKGKTTLLHMIGLIEPLSSGKLIYDNAEIKTNRERLEFFRTYVGFVFQNFALIENKTIKENLSLVKKSGRSEISVADALSAVGLSGRENDKVYTLSGGEQQRVALARLFIKKCSLILADEPTGSLDRNNAKKVIEILKELNAQGKTVVIVTHDDEIKKQCGREISL